MPLDHLWATWRSNYIRGVVDSRTVVPEGEPDDGSSLFERILHSGLADAETLILHRGPTCFVLLNRYPYTAGHLMVLPNRAVADLEALTGDEHREMWALVRDAVVALKAAVNCEAVNVGVNLGAAAGGSQSDHLHVHCVPRWVGDANFIAVAGETRVLPISLDDVYRSLSEGRDVERYGRTVTDDQPTSAADAAPDAVADSDVVDELPDDLNLSEYVGPYTFPNNNRRRIPATIYLVGGLALIGVYLAQDGSSALVNLGTLWGGIGLVLFGVYGLIAGWTLHVEESDALATASTQVGFAVGHASAQLAWRGWLSRPVWRILAYSAENPPKMRGIVLVDGISGDVLEWFAEDNPEDWTELDPRRTRLTE